MAAAAATVAAKLGPPLGGHRRGDEPDGDTAPHRSVPVHHGSREASRSRCLRDSEYGMGSDEQTYELEEGYVSDSEAFTSIAEVLSGVCKAPNMISQVERDQYDYLVSMVDPVRKIYDEDYEALLVAALNALSGGVFKLDVSFHESLLINIFDMSFWSYGPDARAALLELVTSLAAVPDKYLDNCLDMLVGNFVPPKMLRESAGDTWLAMKNEVQGQLHQALHDIAELVPLAPMKLKDAIGKKMPNHNAPKEVTLLFVECMLQLKRDDIWESIGSALLAKVVDLLTDLDVNISWEAILQEEHNKGVFDMDLEDAEENADGFGLKDSEDTGVFKDNAFANKLDGLMVIICEHLKSCAFDGCLGKVFEALMESFRRTLMNAHKSKFAQFVMFYACSLDPEKTGIIFADFLTNIFVSKTVDPLTRMSAVAYLASYLSRAKFVSPNLVAYNLKRLADWCSEYCQFQNRHGILINPKAHRIFYSGCQAVMYILCFRMRLIMGIPELKSLLFNLHLESILCHSLEPLKVCLPTIVREFHRQASAAHLFTSKYSEDNHILESESSKAFGGPERLDMFFPFDPYLLKESDRFMRPNFEYWYMVRTTYSDFSSEHDDGTDGGYLSDDAEIAEDENEDYDTEEDLDYSMNKMSITPKPSFRFHHMAGNLHSPMRMPARLSPSLSP